MGSYDEFSEFVMSDNGHLLRFLMVTSLSSNIHFSAFF